LTRPFDKHLDCDELDKLFSLQSTSASDAGQLFDEYLREAERHVQSCADCSQKLHMYRSVHSEISRLRARDPSPPSAGCIGDAEWLGVAAGLYPEAKTRELMQHAAQCGHCGPLLKNAAEALVNETTPGEEAWLTSLRSAQPEWRKNMAAKLRASAGAKGEDREEREGGQWWNALFSWPGPVVAAIGIVVAVLAGWLGLRVLQPPSADQLLAQAYTEHRTLEVRIAGAKYAPIRVERSTGGSNLDKSSTLLKAEALIGENLGKNPNDPAWLQARARADLLDGNYESAIKSLQRALEALPDSPGLLTDLGSAYFLRAESADRPLDYGNAIEAFGKALDKSPDDPLALFNHALACERMYLYTQAVDDWEHYLRVDPQGEWSDEARQRLLAVQEKIKQHEKSQAEPLLSPKEFVAAVASPDGSSHIEPRIERYLDQGVQSWLPETIVRGGSPSDTRRALELLAGILKNNHDDDWLTEFLQSPPTATEKQAIRALLASDEALHSGHYGRSIELAQQSMQTFKRSENKAGMLRASFALMLAQTFALNFEDCLDTAARALPELAETHYRWLQAQTFTQEGQCLGGSVQLQKGLRAALKGVEIAGRHDYPGLKLRSTAFAAGYWLSTESAERAVRELQNGLATFWQSDVPNGRGENLYSTLADVADYRNLSHVGVLATAEILARFTPKDPIDQADQLAFLAEVEEKAGDYQAAQRALQNASTQLAKLPEDDAVAFRSAEIVVADARVKSHLGDADAALISLAGLRQQFESAEASLSKAKYFETYGEVCTSLGLDKAAKPLLERALAVTETALKSLRLESDKLSWSLAQGQIYRDLLELKLKSETPEQAFSWSEWYRGASLRTSAADDSPSQQLPLSDITSHIPPATALISYILLKDSIAAFVIHDGNLRLATLALPVDLEALALRFLEGCADPSSNSDLLNAQGRRLYNLLVAPLQSDLQDATALRIEADGILDRVPFDLLQGPDGHNLGDRFQITFSPGSAYALHSNSGSPSETFSPASIALIVVASGAGDPSLPVLPGASEEGAEVASHFLQPTLISGSAISRNDVLQNFRAAQVFHFAGHAAAVGNRVGLLLGPEAVLSSRDLVASQPRNLKLAVLSGCDTANGAEGSFADVNSLARTLAAAGVPQIVASRWRVDSVATRQLMNAFYSNLMSGQSPADSLRTASFAIRKVQRYQHPYYWASFAIFGSS